MTKSKTLKLNTMHNERHELIISATKCDPRDAQTIEQIMRDHIFGRTLSSVNRRQFEAGARRAKGFLDFSRTKEGMELAARVEDELFNPEKYR